VTASSHPNWLRLYAEMLRRKGRSVADAQRLPAQPQPWYIVFTWNEQEERSYERWFRAYLSRSLYVPEDRLARESGWWMLDSGLHRRDTCTWPEHHHDEAREADLPRARWLPVRQAMVALPKDQWPTRDEERSTDE